MSSRLEGLASTSPLSPTVNVRTYAANANASKRNTSEPAPKAATKKRRLHSLAPSGEPGGTNGGQSTRLSSLGPLQGDSTSGDEDELSVVADSSVAPASSRLSLSQQGRPPPKPPGPPLAQKITTLVSHLVSNPPRPTAPTRDETAEEASSRISQVQDEFTAVQHKLVLAKARLTEQLTADGGSVGPTPSTTPTAGTLPQRKSGRSSSGFGFGAAVSTLPAPTPDEDDAVASALAHIAALESRRTGLMERLHAAQFEELEASQRRDTERLAAQVDNARLFRRVVDLGPLGTAVLIRSLLRAAGVGEEGIVVAGGGSGADDSESQGDPRALAIKMLVDEDMAREGLLPVRAGPEARNGGTESAV